MSGGDDIGQDVTEYDARRASSYRAGGLDVGLLTDAQHRGADDASGDGRLGNAEGDDDVFYASTEKRHQGDGQNDRGYRHQAVHEPHDHHVDPAVVAGEHADYGPGADCNGGHRHRYHEGYARAVDGSAVDVPAYVVGAEPVLGPGRGEAHERIGQRRVGGEEDRCEYGAQGGEENDEHAQRHVGIATSDVADTADPVPQRWRSLLRPGRGDGRGRLGHPLSVPYPRVEHRVRQVDKQIHRRNDGGEDEHGALYYRVIAVAQRVYQQPPQPGYREHVLSDHDAA